MAVINRIKSVIYGRHLYASTLCFIIRCSCRKRCAHTTSKANHYDTLGIRRDASRKQIRAAFLKLSKERHPDCNRTDPLSHDKFVQLNEAYSVLSRPDSRKRYDEDQARARLHNMYTNKPPNAAHSPGHDFDMYMRRAAEAQWRRNHGYTSAKSAHEKEDERFRTEFDYSEFWQHRRDRPGRHDRDFYNSYAGEWFFLRRSSHSWAVVECVMLLMCGVVLFFVGYGWSNRVRMRMRVRQDKLFAELQAMYGTTEESELDKLVTKEVSASANDVASSEVDK